MHRALGIEEVILEIASHLSDERRDLAALALTARCFELPANAELYRKGNIHCLMSFLGRMIQVSGDAKQDARTRSRCVDQAGLVRMLNLRSSYILQPISAATGLEWNEIYAALTLLRRPLYVFPNLHELDIVSGDPETMMLVDALLCPTLRKLSLFLLIYDPGRLDVWQSRLFGLIEGIPVKASGISRLEMCLDTSRRGWREDFDSRLSNILGQHCRHLPLVTLLTNAVPNTPHLLLNLAHIESLDTITLHPAPDQGLPVSLDIDRDRRLYRDISGFRSVKKAELRDGDLIHELVRCLTGAPLRVLDVEVATWGPHMASLFDVICTFAGTLTELYIRESRHSQTRILSREYLAYTLPTAKFTRLGRCSLVQYFRFIFSPPLLGVLDLHNSDLALLAKSWPMLKDLDIHYGGRDIPDVPLNLGGLAAFSLYCSNLESIDVRPLSPTLNVPAPPSVPRHLWKSLIIHYPSSFSKISSHATVTTITHYMDALWPDVFLVIVSSHSDFEQTPSIPRSMNDILTGLRTARTMRPGSRWRVQREAEGVGQLSDMPDLSFSRYEWSEGSITIPETCPWEILS